MIETMIVVTLEYVGSDWKWTQGIFCEGDYVLFLDLDVDKWMAFTEKIY